MTITDTQNSVNAIRLAFKKVREGLIDAAHAAGMLESDLVNALSSIPVETQAPEPEPVEQETPAPTPAPKLTPEAVEQKTYTHDDIKAEITAIARQLTDNEEQQKFSQTVQELLQQFGVEKLSQLPADKLTEFITAVKERV
ncbi:hypothetical protein ACQXYJ_10805 [Corynebacterium diphtheriae]|nr:hypothetical protein FRC0263_01974 [Corynebacterium diphtheriae]